MIAVSQPHISTYSTTAIILVIIVSIIAAVIALACFEDRDYRLLMATVVVWLLACSVLIASTILIYRFNWIEFRRTRR